MGVAIVLPTIITITAVMLLRKVGDMPGVLRTRVEKRANNTAYSLTDLVSQLIKLWELYSYFVSHIIIIMFHPQVNVIEVKSVLTSTILTRLPCAQSK